MPAQRHSQLKIVILAIVFYALFSLPAAQAITYGSTDCTDCTDNSTNTCCAHPNVVSISGFTPGGYSSFRCTGSLLSKDEDHILILTAGHCVQAWINRMSDGLLEDIGVSFDAEIMRAFPDSTAFSADQFVLGGSPLLNRDYGPSLHAWNTHYDYAVVAFDVPVKGLKTDDGTAVDLTGIEPVVLPVEDFILTILDPTSPPLLTNVGYGFGESLNRPGHGGNAGGATPDSSVFGFRYVSMFTAQLNTMLKRQSMVIGSQKPGPRI